MILVVEVSENHLVAQKSNLKKCLSAGFRISSGA